MRIPNIYSGQALTEHGRFSFDGSVFQHLIKSLRFKVGYQLRLFDGSGDFFDAKIVEVEKRSVTIDTFGSEPSLAEPKLHTHIGQAISRGDRMDYAIQKSTELGVSEITPLFTDRCEVKLEGSRLEKKHAQWQDIAISAAEQCGRASIPAIHPPINIEQWLSERPQGSLKLVLHHRDTQSLASMTTPESVEILIGPEGGLSDNEIHKATARAFFSTTFGPRVFRTETAPVAALSIVNWLWGDF